MTIICSIILFITGSFSFLNAIRISKEPGHYINSKIQYSTARTAVLCIYVIYDADIISALLESFSKTRFEQIYK